MILVRNENWSRRSDPVRKAYPDSWVVQLGLEPKLVDQRLLDPSGEESSRSARDIQPENLPTVFSDPLTVAPAVRGPGRRAV